MSLTYDYKRRTPRRQISEWLRLMGNDQRSAKAYLKRIQRIFGRASKQGPPVPAAVDWSSVNQMRIQIETRRDCIRQLQILQTQGGRGKGLA